MRIAIAVGEGRLEIGDREPARVGEHAIGLRGDAEQVGAIAQVQAEAEDDRVEFAVGEGQLVGGAHFEAQLREAPASLPDRRGGRIDAGSRAVQLGAQRGEQLAVAAADLEHPARRGAGAAQQHGHFARRARPLALRAIAREPGVGLGGEEGVFLAHVSSGA